MPGKNLFDKPFDDGTKSKLEIFKQYFEEWLPVFVSGKTIFWKNVQVFDFFAGMGEDKAGNNGSPLIILNIANSLSQYTKNNKIKLQLNFNEKELDKYEALVENVEKFEKSDSYTCQIRNNSFKDLFDEYYPTMQNSANFIFLDQNGIKEITEDIFSKIITLKQTDFLFFISSSYFKRFAQTPEFRKYFPNIDDNISTANYYHIHRKVLNHYKSLIPTNKKYFLAPFSIRKGSSIYGLIFGTNHTFGLEKFLTVAWKVDKLRGEANYDIDDDKIESHAPSLFNHLNIPTKRQIFEKNLSANILNSTLKSDTDVYLYTLCEGFLLKDANPILKKLKTEGRIHFDFTPISSDLHKIKNASFIKVQ